MRNPRPAEIASVNHWRSLGPQSESETYENRIQAKEITTVCCVCGGHLSGPWPAAAKDLSHGYCKQHYQTAMQEIQAYLALLERQQSLAPRALAA